MIKLSPIMFFKVKNPSLLLLTQPSASVLLSAEQTSLPVGFQDVESNWRCSLIAQFRESRGLPAANSSLTNNTERSVAREKALGPMSPNITQRGHAKRYRALARNRESVSKSREHSKTICNGGKYRSKAGSPAWQSGPAAQCYIKHKIIVIKY